MNRNGNKMNRTGSRMNGDTQKTLNRWQTILGFGTFPVLCDCVTARASKRRRTRIAVQMKTKPQEEKIPTADSVGQKPYCCTWNCCCCSGDVSRGWGWDNSKHEFAMHFIRHTWGLSEMWGWAGRKLCTTWLSMHNNMEWTARWVLLRHLQKGQSMCWELSP